MARVETVRVEIEDGRVYLSPFAMSLRTRLEWFEALGLDQWGNEPGYVAPKPLNNARIEKLGAALDAAEYQVGAMWDDEFADERSDYADAEDYHDAVHHRFHTLKCEYGQAIATRNRYRRWKYENVKRVISDKEGLQLKLNMWGAQWAIDKLDKLGPDFSTYREFVDANSNHTMTTAVFEIAQQKFYMAQREAIADRKAGINRTR